MGLGTLRTSRLKTKKLHRRPTLELLERRELFAVYLPDTFAHADRQPVGTAFNGGEQLFFGGHNGGLQVEFGSSTASSGYTGTAWNRRDVDELIPGSLPGIVGTPSLYQAAANIGGVVQLHATYRASGGKLIDVWSSPWQSRELVASGVASDPTASTFNGGRQVMYVSTDGRVHIVASPDQGATWFDTDLTDLVGLGADASAVAVATSGVASLQVGNFEYYVYHRADGGLGYFLWNGTAWGYDVLDASDFAGYVPPTTGAKGALEGVSYATSGSGTPNVGWVMFRDGGGTLRGVWLAQGGPWQSARISNVQMQGAVSAAFDPGSGRLHASFVDVNGHLHLLREAATWVDTDFHAGSTITMPLANMGTEFPAGAFLKFADGTVITVSAELAGTSFNETSVVFVQGAVRGAVYDSLSKTITVTLTGDTSKANLAATINALPEFKATAGLQGFAFSALGDGFGLVGTLRGGSEIKPGNAVKPDLYFRPHAAAGAGAGLHLLYKDQSNHVHNKFVAGGVFDTTAYLEGYRHTYGYGIVNAAAAVAYSINSSTPIGGANGGAWNLSLVRAPSAWNVATGQNVAVFALDSGIDTTNSDVVLLTGVNVAAGNANTTDVNGHGTGVASLIAGLNDAQGVTGVAFNSRVVPVKVGDNSVASESAIVAGINYASDYIVPSGYVDGTKILNMSFATTAASLNSVRDKMYEKSWSTVFVSAAGNRTLGSPDLPALYSVGFGIVAGAVNSASQLWSPSGGTNGPQSPYNYLLAPGVGVSASTLVGSSGNDHNTALVNGTSAAAAHISGVVALMLEANPELTAREMESILIASAEQVVTQTLSATAPAISAVFYFAGGDEQAAAAAGLIAGQPASPATTETHAELKGISKMSPVAASITVPTSSKTIDNVLIEAVDDVLASDEARVDEEVIALLAGALNGVLKV